MGHADLLADVQHRRLVAFPFADDDRAVNRHRIHHATHRLDGDLIRLVTIALPHGVGACDRRLLDDSEEFEGEIGIHHGNDAYFSLLTLTASLSLCAGSSHRVGRSAR